MSVKHPNHNLNKQDTLYMIMYECQTFNTRTWGKTRSLSQSKHNLKKVKTQKQYQKILSSNTIPKALKKVKLQLDYLHSILLENN